MYKKLLILASVSPMGQIGNGIFILISGYFMANKGKDIDLTKMSKKLLIQMGFTSITLTVMSMAWFIGYYFAVIVLVKVSLTIGFLNGIKRIK